MPLFDRLNSDLIQKLIKGDQETTIYTDEGQLVDVFADKMVRMLQGYRRAIRLGQYYEENSAQHTANTSTGHITRTP